MQVTSKSIEHDLDFSYVESWTFIATLYGDNKTAKERPFFCKKDEMVNNIGNG